jgi:DNA-binding beta-propeller fold protein YncE
MPAAPAASNSLAQPRAKAPYLYVGGSKISEFALGATKPLRTVNVEAPEVVVALALDAFGHLFAEYGTGSSGGVIVVYDARTLAKEYVIPNTAGFGSIALDSKGNLYYCFGDPVWVYPPGYTKPLYKIRHNAHDATKLALDASGELYADGRDRISVFAPNGPDGRMKWERSFHDGVDSSDALTFAPNGDLYVADYPDCNPPCGRSTVRVYPPGASEPSLTIRSGIESPVALAVDSTGLLYVANSRYGSGWVSVYAPGSAHPTQRIRDGINRPNDLAIDPSDNLYVANANANSVTVYSPGGAKLLYTITKGLKFAEALAIGRP